MITISMAQWLNLAINTVLPAVVALVTARVADSSVKAVMLLFLSAVSGFLVSYLDAVNGGAAFDWQQVAFTALSGFAAAVLAHFGLLKPLGVTGSAGAIQSAMPRGVGGRGRHEV